MLRGICVLVVLVLAYHQMEGLPQRKSITEMSHGELMHKFAQFVHDDREATEIRQMYEKEIGSHRLKRQAEEGMDDVDDPNTQQAGQEGFLDRAAKFVLELVQRFLKWINTE